MKRDLGKPTIDLVLATKAICERDIEQGFLDPDRLRYTIMAKADRAQLAKELHDKGVSARKIAKLTGVSHPTILKDLDGQDLPENGNNLPPDPLAQERKRVAALQQQLKSAQTPAAVLSKQYGTLVIDPPWPMKKIEREVRPNQIEFDYPTMDYEQLRSFRPIFQTLTDSDCHVFMWTTQRFLPMALRLLEDYAVKYVLTMVWHKPGGFQPVGLPQYNCEFVLYGRVGSPDFIDTTAFNCCFEASRREHSRKPDEFYDLVRRVTAGERVDVFSREPRAGFDQFGNESNKFSREAAE